MRNRKYALRLKQENDKLRNTLAQKKISLFNTIYTRAIDSSVSRRPDAIDITLQSSV